MANAFNAAATNGRPQTGAEKLIEALRRRRQGLGR